MEIPADYTTLENVRRAILQANLETDTGDDPLLKDFIRSASGFISDRTGRSFVPFHATYSFDYKHSYRLDVMPYDLLTLVTLVNGDQVDVDPTHIVYAPRNSWPKYRIELKASKGTVFSYVDDWQEALLVEAVWGYHTSPNNMWVDTTATVPAGGISSSDRYMDIDDIETLDDNGRLAFEVKGYYQIDDEVMQCVDIIATDNDSDPTTYQVRWSRGVLGTTRALHTEGTEIDRYVPDEAIETLCARLAVWLYQHRDVSEGATSLLNGAVILKDDTLRGIFEQIDIYQKPVMYSD